MKSLEILNKPSFQQDFIEAVKANIEYGVDSCSTTLKEVEIKGKKYNLKMEITNEEI